jgi:hypothetical protein
MLRGKNGRRGKFHAFYAAVKRAEADGEMRDLALIAKAAEDNWQAAAWKLERKYPAKWGRKDASKVELSGEVKGSINITKLQQVIINTLDPEERAKISAKLIELAKDGGNTR